MTGRIVAIDAVRGFCLLNIFINHITLGIIKEASVSKLGLSDTAEIFVLLAGVSAYLHFGRLRMEAMTGRLWRRGAKLYVVNLGIILSTILVAFLIDDLNGAAPVFETETIDVVQNHPYREVFWSLLTFQQTIGYSVVLRLYLYLMLCAPVAIWLASKRWWLPLLPAFAIWAAAGHFDLVLRNSLTGEPVALTLLPWTLIFTCGVALGAAIRQGVALPRPAWAVPAAFSFVVSCMLLTAVGPRVSTSIDLWFATRNDQFWLGASKTYQSPLRLLHALSVTYLFLALPKAPLVRLFYEIAPSHALCRLGRSSLAVFTVGAIAAILANEVIFAAAQAFPVSALAPVVAEILFVALSVMAMIAISTRPDLKQVASTLRDRLAKTLDRNSRPQPALAIATVDDACDRGSGRGAMQRSSGGLGAP